VGISTGLLEHRVRQLGDQYGRRRRKPALARADLNTNVVRELTLEVVHDVPPRRHALLTNWPESDLERQKNLAMNLAAKAALVVRPS
jgi:hypothetical protein